MIKKFREHSIKESIESDENGLSFIEKTKDVSIYGLHKSKYAAELNIIERDDYDITVSSMMVSWQIDMGVKKYGLWKFRPEITSVEGPFDVTIFDENGDTKEEKTINFTSEGFKFQTNLDVSEGHGDILVSGITIDFEKNIITADVQVCIQPQTLE